MVLHNIIINNCFINDDNIVEATNVAFLLQLHQCILFNFISYGTQLCILNSNLIIKMYAYIWSVHEYNSLLQ